MRLDQHANDEVQYTVHFETMALSASPNDVSPVPVSVTFTAVETDNNDFGGFELIDAEVTISQDVLSDYAALLLPRCYVNLVSTDGALSGTVSLIFGDGCGSYIRLDLLFRDIPLGQDD